MEILANKPPHADEILLALRSGSKLEVSETKRSAFAKALEYLREERLIEIANAQVEQREGRGDNFTFAKSEITGTFRLTIRGELETDRLMGLNSNEVATTARRAILQAALLRGRHKGVVTTDVVLPNVGPARREEFFKNLESRGLLQTVGIKKGLFSIAGYATTIEGERALDKLESRNSKELEQHALRRIMLEALHAQTNGNALAMGSTPFVEDVGRTRMEFLVQNLVDEGYLQRTSIPQGMFSTPAYQLTEAGEERAQDLLQQNPRRSAEAAKKLPNHQPRV